MKLHPWSLYMRASTCNEHYMLWPKHIIREVNKTEKWHFIWCWKSSGKKKYHLESEYKQHLGKKPCLRNSCMDVFKTVCRESMLTLISLAIKSHQAGETRIMQNTTLMCHAQVLHVLCPRLSMDSQAWLVGLGICRTLQRTHKLFFLSI